MKFYLNDKEITKKEAENMLGAERLENRIAEAIEEHNEDPLTLLTWMDGFEIRF